MMNLPIDLTVKWCTFDLPYFARDIFCNMYIKFINIVLLIAYVPIRSRISLKSLA